MLIDSIVTSYIKYNIVVSFRGVVSSRGTSYLSEAGLLFSWQSIISSLVDQVISKNAHSRVFNASRRDDIDNCDYDLPRISISDQPITIICDERGSAISVRACRESVIKGKVNQKKIAPHQSYCCSVTPVEIQMDIEE